MTALTRTRPRIFGSAALLACGCTDPLLDDSTRDACTADDGTDFRAVSPEHLPEPGGPCLLDPPAHGLLLTTTDFATGALTVVDIDTQQVTPDVALGTADGVPHWHDQRGYIVHRHMFDFVDVLESRNTSWTSHGQHPVDAPSTSAPNPRSIAFDSNDLGFVPLHSAGAVAVLDFSRPPGSSQIEAVDLSAFEADGNPNPSLAMRCGNTIWVSVERLDAGFARVGPDALVPIDAQTRTALDLDPDRPGGQGIAVRGAWIRQIRRDPVDPDGHTLLALTSGIERIDLSTGMVQWLVAPQTLADVGICHHLLPLSFDVDDDGETIYLAAYGRPELDCSENWAPCFEHPARLFRIDITDGEAGSPVPFADDLDAVGPTLEVVGDTLYFGSTRAGEPGLFLYDISMNPPVRLDGPLSTGLSPYAMTVIGP